MTTEYAKYRGRSVGRILHALNMICTNWWQLDHMIIGNGIVRHGHDGPILARYHWNPDDETDDTPIFDFQEENNPWARRQAINRPFIDDLYTWQTPEYCTQEVRKILSFDEALAIRWIRDKFDSDWNSMMESTRNHIEKKAKRILRKITWNRADNEWYDKHWKHFAMCAVLEI